MGPARLYLGLPARSWEAPSTCPSLVCLWVRLGAPEGRAWLKHILQGNPHIQLKTQEATESARVLRPPPACRPQEWADFMAKPWLSSDYVLSAF